jgi:hypothetical protein
MLIPSQIPSRHNDPIRGGCRGLPVIMTVFEHESSMGPALVSKQPCLWLSAVGIGTGNPGVFQGYPHPYPRKPGGYTTRARVCLQNRLKNLTTAVQVSIDTAVQHCEVKSGGGELGWAARHWYGSGRRSRLCSRFILVFGYMFVWAVRAGTGCG